MWRIASGGSLFFMKLVMTLLVRDEEDILRENIEFHLSRGVDFVIAMDNRSVDGTRNILRDFERRGVLRYLFQPEDDYSQHRWVSQMAHMAHKDYGADWVINNDADEFWWPEQGDLKSTLAAWPEHSLAASASRVNFIPRGFSTGARFFETMTIRDARSTNAFGDPLPGKVCHRGRLDVEVAQGNHAVEIAGQPVDAPPAPIVILHFPMRSYAQFVNKIRLGGAAYARNTALDPAQGGAWRKLYEVWKARDLPDYYQDQLPDDGAIADGLAQGRLVTDERLRRALADIMART